MAGRGVGDGLGHHGLAGAGRSVQEDAAGRVDADLGVQMVLDEGELDGLPYLLLLRVHAANVLVGDVGLFGHELDGRVGFRGEDVDDGMRVAMQGDGGVGLEQLPVQGGQDAHVVVGPGRRRHDAVVGVDHLVELADDQRDGLDAGDLLLGPEQLPLQMAHLVLEVFLLQLDELQLRLKGLHVAVQVGLCLFDGRAVREGLDVHGRDLHLLC